MGPYEYDELADAMRALEAERAKVKRLREALQETLRVLVTPAGFPDKGKGRTGEQQSAFDAARAALKETE